MACFHPAYAAIVFLVVSGLYCLLCLKNRGLVTSGLISCLTASIALVIMLVGKYASAIGEALFPQNDPILAYFIMPLGVSYFFFRIVQYAFDHHRGIISEESFLHLYVFVTFLPLVPAGPVETYQGFYGKRLKVRDVNEHLEGIRRLLLGFFKKLFVVGILFDLLDGSFKSLIIGDLSHSISSHSNATFYAFLTYAKAFFDMAAYADLAIGCSLLFGFKICENLNRPYASLNLSEFWQRWHISVSNWCRNNIFFPVFGATRKVWLGLICSMLFMGLWHSLNLNWLSWALLHGGALSVIYFMGILRLRNPAFQVWSKKPIYLFSSWLFTQLFVAAVYLVAMPVPFERAIVLFFYCIPGMVCLFIAGVVLFVCFGFARTSIKSHPQLNSLVGRMSDVFKAWFAEAASLTRGAFAKPMLFGLGTSLILLVGLDIFAHSGYFARVIPESRFLLNRADFTGQAQYQVARAKTAPGDSYPLYLLGGSTVRQAYNASEIESRLRQKIGMDITVYNFGLTKGSFARDLTVLDYLKDAPKGMVVVNPGLIQFANVEGYIPIRGGSDLLLRQGKYIKEISLKLRFALSLHSVSYRIVRYIKENYHYLIKLQTPEYDNIIRYADYNSINLKKNNKNIYLNLGIDAESYLLRKAIHLNELSEIIDTARMMGHDIVCILLPFAQSLIDDYENSDFNDYRKLVVQLCKDKSVLCLDYAVRLNLPLEYFYDMVHVKRQGRKLITDSFCTDAADFWKY